MIEPQRRLFSGIKMEFACNKSGSCKRCGRCCTIRERGFISEKTDLELRKRIFQKTGIVYLHPLPHYSLSLSSGEAGRLKKRAKEHNISITIKPKKIFIDTDKVVVYDFFLDHDVCPFLKKNLCLIYDDRPKVCRDFPRIETENDFFVKENPMLFEEAVNIASSQVVGLNPSAQS